MSLRSSLELSREEVAELRRSTKKAKETHQAEAYSEARLLGANAFTPPGKHEEKISFKDKLIGEIPGAYMQAFDFSDYVENEVESEINVESIREGFAAVNLSREFKQLIRAPWTNALIIKVFGRSVGFNFLNSRIHALWKPKGKLDCVDLDCEFYLIRFSLREDHDLVLKNGPWFIGEHFLSVRPWVPNFRPDVANIAAVAVWVRLPHLPIEYYNAEALKEIGQAIGTVLRIDTHTASETRARYARLCVQVDINKPLIYTILIGNFQQPVLYEGINQLCFSCGRVGHRREVCQYTIRAPSPDKPDGSVPSCKVDGNGKDNSTEVHHVPDSGKLHHVPESTNKSSSGQLDADGYGPWLVVTRKKHGAKDSRRSSGSESPIENQSGSYVKKLGSSYKTGLGLMKEGKRKADGPLEVTTKDPSTSKLFNQRVQSVKPTKSPGGHKGKSQKPLHRASSLAQHQKSNAALNSTAPVSESSEFSFGAPCHSNNGNFTFSSETQREIGDNSGGKNHRNSKHSFSDRNQCQIGIDSSKCLSGATNGAVLVGFQTEHSRKDGIQSCSMEECVAAITSAGLMRIRPGTISSGKEIDGNSSDIVLSDGELECREADSGVSLHNSDQPSLAPKGDDVGSSSTVQLTDTKERLLQGDAAPDRMELEGGGEASGPL
nr:uncharacterized protein CFP56_55205 [Quercus suber]